MAEEREDVVEGDEGKGDSGGEGIGGDELSVDEIRVLLKEYVKELKDGKNKSVSASVIEVGDGREIDLAVTQPIARGRHVAGSGFRGRGRVRKARGN